MAIYKCKMCGGTLDVQENQTTIECDYCGTKQTVPKLDDDRKANLFDRASHFRRNNEYDKAMAIYEQVLNEDRTDAESYWSLVLCRYGIEYVEDPTTHKQIPTVNRAQYTSIFDDDNYKSALEYADETQKILYETEATQINEIQKGILEISQKEKPFDVFICYKETDKNGRRTQDSVLANDLYHQLIQEGFKVFFSRITLEDKLGSAYEPYIFAALNSAKVMVVLGTKAEYFNAVWVKNEWSRYLGLVKESEGKKVLIPAYRDMDPYDLPEEFSHLQAQDMGKLGFMQDLIRGIKKITEETEYQNTAKETVVVNQTTGGNVVALLRRVDLYLEDGDWKSADEYCERVLDIEPENAEAYLGKLMAEIRCHKKSELMEQQEPFDNSNNYTKVLRFGDDALKQQLQNDVQIVNERKELNRLTELYQNAVEKEKNANTEKDYLEAAEQYELITDFKDAKQKAEKCRENAEIVRKDMILKTAKKMFDDAFGSYDEKINKIELAKENFIEISGWKDADQWLIKCDESIVQLKQQKADEAKDREQHTKRKKKIANTIGVVAFIVVALILVTIEYIIPRYNYNKAIKLCESGNYDEAIDIFTDLGDYKDCQDKVNDCNYQEAIELYEEGTYEEGRQGFEELDDYSESQEYILKCDQGILRDSVVGDTVIFGSYEQDGTTSNGKEPISWLVLDKTANGVLLVSKEALDCQLYNADYTDVTWESSSIREWLNTDFLKSAFSENERTLIQKILVKNDNNQEFGTDGGNDTEDSVFLLSIDEVNNYFNENSKKICSSTEYVNKSTRAYNENGKCWWWLRSPGYDAQRVAYVDDNGVVYNNGCHVYMNVISVRPALWINLES